MGVRLRHIATAIMVTGRLRLLSSKFYTNCIKNSKIQIKFSGVNFKTYQGALGKVGIAPPGTLPIPVKFELSF